VTATDMIRSKVDDMHYARGFCPQRTARTQDELAGEYYFCSFADVRVRHGAMMQQTTSEVPVEWGPGGRESFLRCTTANSAAARQFYRQHVLPNHVEMSEPR
jgi:hypothetical protein